ncbi:hypothetical protein AU210_016216 [Fusarium oxysporum f. sp. radicis-cucumerinum]|uniref:Uncharacterized protein n=1 Tax=Fusarium oxysporum f. sp. radicis-cucumerinum TaxID=327505 RepID=A0A2H3G662_FUSOX|nr:hypothetical protein AU210_016216 [Fusarium oxysporum f. sp. radicis-cucumerinum]
MDQPALHRRGVTRSRFGDNARINLGDIHYHLPHPAARAEVIRVIPYPRNEDLVHRRDLIDRLHKLLPPTAGSCCAALWGLGGSGKTQIALDYAYRRCDADDDCCVFWVHADSEATFLADYKTIGKKLGVDERLDGRDLLDAVCNEIEARPKWLMILDNADNLRLFGVGQTKGEGMDENLHKYVPCMSQGTVLWTSRDAHIVGTLVGARRGIEVRSMAVGEATTLLARVRDEPLTAEEAVEEAGVNALLQELQCLPLAISQAGAYMRRMSMTAEQYLDLLGQGKTRWEVLKVSDSDRHRRPEVSNSVLETWRISTERIRTESQISYQILHVVAYVDSQDIPQELMVAAGRYDAGSVGSVGSQDSTRQVSELEVLEAITRLREFSFLGLRQTDDGGRRYEMHKLVQEAIRYGLRVRGSVVPTIGNALKLDKGPKEDEGYYYSKALQVVDDLFPSSEPATWVRCEEYLTHAIRVGEWAEVGGAGAKTATLLQRVSRFLHDRGRWREKEPVDSRTWGLRQAVLGEKHPDTINSMASLAATYHEQGRYGKAEPMKAKALQFRREVLGKKHPDTMQSMADLADTYYSQGRYDEAERLTNEALELRREVLGEKHPDTISSMADLAATCHAQGRYAEAQIFMGETLALRREVLGEKHPNTISSMAELAAAYHTQGRYAEAEIFMDEALALRREVLGEKHPDAIWSMAELAAAYHTQGRYDEAERLRDEALELRREVLGGEHPDTIWSMADLATTYHAQHRYDEAEGIYQEVLDLRREVLGGRHPDTIWTMADLSTTYHEQGRYDEAEKLKDKALELRRQVLGEKHPDTISSMASLATTYHNQGRYNTALELHQTALDLRRNTLGATHPDTMQSVAYLASTQDAIQQPPSLAESVQPLAVKPVKN